MNYHDLDSLRLLTRERHEQRSREGDAERLARNIRSTTPRRRRLRTLGLARVIDRRAAQPRLEA
jgi:hypothetical protein